jgi:23S rRNA (pseudouridine1915-N3)-methyltransferase
MKILLLSIGKTKDKYIQRGIEEYTGRLKHYCSFEYKEWTSGKGKGSRSQIKQKEAKWIQKQISPTDHCILLDENGRQFSSRKFAHKVEKWLMHTQGNLVFVIGGAYGFTDELKKQSDGLLSLSKMTFSHQMIRIFILEQIYRAFTILRGESYHND